MQINKLQFHMDEPVDLAFLASFGFFGFFGFSWLF